MITGARRKSLYLAGLMLPDPGFKTLAKLSFPFADKGSYFPHIADRMKRIATSDGRAAWDFETSTREFKDTLANCRTVTREFSGTLEASFVNSTRDGRHTCSKEFCESIKKGLMCQGIPVYGYSAPAKSGAGISLPEMYRATHDAPSVFFCVVSQPHTFFSATGIIRFARKIMVGCAGASSEAPVSLYAGKANPAQSTTRQISLCGGGSKTQYKEAATCWLQPLPKFRNSFGLSPLFAAICRQLPQKFTILLRLLSVKPAVLWFGITSAFSLVASVWRWLMRNYFRITGYAVNKRGLTVGIGYQLISSDTKTATAHAVLQAQREGLSHVRITRVQEVSA